MALDYISVGVSIVIFGLYFAIFFMLIEIKKRVAKELEKSFNYMMIAVILLAIRRVQQIFITSQIVKSVPYFIDIVTLIFVILFSMAIYHFYIAIKGVKAKKTKQRKTFTEKNRQWTQDDLKEKVESIKNMKKPSQGKYVYLDLTK